nr:DUF4166 domain-containing protein [Sphingomonas gei]
MFEGRSIHTGFRQQEADAPLYRKILGSAFSTLPPRLQELHGSSAAREWTGFAEVRRGRGPAAVLVAALVGFPRSATQVPVTVTFSPEGEAERWVRNFGGKRFSSLQSAGTGRNEHLLVEKFGPATFALALIAESGRLTLIPRRWSFLGIPMPKFLLPAGSSFETEREGLFCFDVEISTPLIGRIVAYRGTLRCSGRANDPLESVGGAGRP